jgi:hypothetical protein
MYRYLFVSKGRDHFLIEEPSGQTLHLVLQFLHRMKIVFPEVVFTRFKGRLIPPEYAKLDLVFVVPKGAAPPLLGQIIEGFAHVTFNHPEPGTRIRSTGKQCKILIGRRTQRQCDAAPVEHSFAIGSKFLVALLRLDAIQTQWLPGTTSGRKPGKRRLAFFIDRAGEPLFDGKRGRFLAPRESLPE